MAIVMIPAELAAQLLEPTPPVEATVSYTVTRPEKETIQGKQELNSFEYQFSSDGFLTYESKRRLALLADHLLQSGTKLVLNTDAESWSDGDFMNAWQREQRIVDFLNNCGVDRRAVERHIILKSA